MNELGLILYGPPASGKNAVTDALVDLDPTFSHYMRFKAGTGRTRGYEMIDEDALTEMRQRGDVLYENTRYGNRYVVDRPHLRELVDAGTIPVIHLGQVAGVRTLISSPFPARWLAVLLWCSRGACRLRISERDPSDIGSRLSVWDETEQDLADNGIDDFDLCIDTEQHRPDEAARLIQDSVRSRVTDAS